MRKNVRAQKERNNSSIFLHNIFRNNQFSWEFRKKFITFDFFKKLDWGIVLGCGDEVIGVFTEMLSTKVMA
jgi:hypothetical protein